VTLDYITGYADQISVAPGETIRFMVSARGATAVAADVVRTRCGDRNPAGPGFSETPVVTGIEGRYPVEERHCPAGSYLRAPDSPRLQGLESFTLQVVVWPTLPGRAEQALLGTWSATARRGFVLLLDAQGVATLRLGDGQQVVDLSSGCPLQPRHWYLLAASYDAASGQLTLRQEPLARAADGDVPLDVKRDVRLGPLASTAPFLLAAWQVTPERVGGHYDGKLERPRVADRALSCQEIELLRGDNVPPALAQHLVAAWAFQDEIATTAVPDRSANALHAEAINLPARGMTDSTWRGTDRHWRDAPAQYAAIHFHHDDIYNAGWPATVTLPVPADLPSGLYALRLVAGDLEDRIPFAVRPPRGKATAPIAFLASSATWMAYGNLNPLPFDIAELLSGRLIQLTPANLLIDAHPEWGGSLYDVHADGSGVCYSSRLRPMLNMRPGYISSFGCQGSGLREFNADTHVVDWLDSTGQPYDVVTDEDLHAEGLDLLQRYRVVVTGTHPEYFSTAMLEAVRAWRDEGGRLMVLGGNGFYWRIAYHASLPGVMEVRRSGPAIRTWECQPGEDVQSFDGEIGGLWRHLGKAPQSSVGAGFVAEGFDVSSYYRRSPASRDPRAAFIFDGLEDVEIIGDFGCQGGGAAGVEIDRADLRLGTPAHALILGTSEGHTESYRLVNEEISIAIPNVTGGSNPRIAADLVFFESPGGGAVFNTGSIAWAGSLSHANYANNVARITSNVLRRFLDPSPIVRHRGSGK
jgi:N,N-dimethylformamidase